MTIINKQIGERLKEFREKKGLNQEETAFQAGIDYSYYNQLENGKRNPSIKTLLQICEVLGIDIKDLL